MKNKKKVFILFLALCFAFALAACGEKTPGSSPTPDPSESSAPQDEATSIAGTYRFDYTDPYGDVTSFTVTLKDDGSFNIMTLGAMGSGIYNGTEWTDNGDGTFTTGATDNTIDTEWVAEDGIVTWKIDGGNAIPVDYVEPTEFLEKDLTKDPTTAAEAVGVYVFGQINAWGTPVPYVVWVNADGTYDIHMNNSRTGLHTYSGSSWSINQDSVITFGPATYEGNAPQGDWFNADDGFSSAWILRGDGTCEPVNLTDDSTSIDVSTLPAEIYPAGANLVGVYVFGSVNAWGTPTPYVLWLNANGTAMVHMNSERIGMHSYYADEWTLEDDGTISIGALIYEGNDPQGEWFDADHGFSSTWKLNPDGTCEPTNYTGSISDVDVSTLPAEIYPVSEFTGGTYYFGSINAWGSEVPYALCLGADGSCQIVMDNRRTGVHVYTGDWTDNGDGTVSISALNYDGDAPQGDWFSADNGYASTWTLNTDGSCVPAGYTGDTTDVTKDSFTEEALSAINAF